VGPKNAEKSIYLKRLYYPVIVLRTGIDLLEINRLDELDTAIRARFYSASSPRAKLADAGDSSASLAGRFAVKEAVAKALGCGMGRSLAVRLRYSAGPQGEPLLLLHGNPRKLQTALACSSGPSASATAAPMPWQWPVGLGAAVNIWQSATWSWAFFTARSCRPASNTFDLAIGCGDLPYYYLEISSPPGYPALFRARNHAPGSNPAFMGTAPTLGAPSICTAGPSGTIRAAAWQALKAACVIITAATSIARLEMWNMVFAWCLPVLEKMEIRALPGYLVTHAPTLEIHR